MYTNILWFQYPGVAESINHDIDNLVTLLKVYQVLPPGIVAIIHFITIQLPKVDEISGFHFSFMIFFSFPLKAL